jgi:protoheme ferro-lyase
LHEIDIEHRAQARKLGIHHFRMVPGLNDTPRFIGVLGQLVRARVSQAAPELRA